MVLKISLSIHIFRDFWVLYRLWRRISFLDFSHCCKRQQNQCMGQLWAHWTLSSASPREFRSPLLSATTRTRGRRPELKIFRSRVGMIITLGEDKRAGGTAPVPIVDVVISYMPTLTRSRLACVSEWAEQGADPDPNTYPTPSNSPEVGHWVTSPQGEGKVQEPRFTP